MKLLIWTVALVFLWASTGTLARTLWENPADSNESVFLNSALKGTFLQSTVPLEPTDSTASSIFFGRMRVEPVYRVGDLVLDAAYDNEIIEDNNPVTTLNVLPSTRPAAFRINQVGGNIFQTVTGVDYNELDRLFAAYQKDRLHITLGRQAIGWGRAMAFSAVDIFSPFTPFQFDREWKRGVDAVRVEVKMTDKTSAEVIFAGGPDWEDSALGGRIRGAFEKSDFEFLLAKRAQDTMWAATSSAPVSGAEIHAELALFQTSGDFPSAGFFGDSKLVPKGVLGISNNFQIGNGLTASLEYHYSGFGAVSAAQFNQWYQIPSYQNRIMRGDTQIYGNQASFLNFDYTINEKWKVAFEALQSLIDSSGAIIPSLTWDLSDNSSFLGTALIPYGAAPSGTQLNSQFGSGTQTLIIQLRVYD